MLAPEVYAERRARLMADVSHPILLGGVGHRARNLPDMGVPFRQDSTFWYFTGCRLPDAAVWMEGGRTTLYLPEPAADDALWHGVTTPFGELGLPGGIDEVRPLDRAALAERARGRAVTVPSPDQAVTAWLAEAVGHPLRYGAGGGTEGGDEALVRAIIDARRRKSSAEIAEMRDAGRISAAAHRLVMRRTRPGVSEQALTALFEAALYAQGHVPAYGTILTQRGEVLHNHDHGDVLEAGRLLLLDGGGEALTSGYAADITRTWPVSGRFDTRQRSAYEAVLEAQLAAIDTARVGVPYREVHDAASRVIARFLLDEGLLRNTTVDAAVERGAHALFFPHGTGHLIGLDVHDLKSFGDRAAYPPGSTRSPLFGTGYLRFNLPLEPGFCFTIEPGFYVVPAILNNPGLRQTFADVLDVDRAASWIGFGGIRIEDDIHLTPEGPEILSHAVPKEIGAMEDLIGQGGSLEDLRS